MEDMNVWALVVGVVAPVATGLGASLYLGWKAKVLADGVDDWRDDAVDFIDNLLDAVDTGDDLDLDADEEYLGDDADWDDDGLDWDDEDLEDLDDYTVYEEDGK